MSSSSDAAGSAAGGTLVQQQPAGHQSLWKRSLLFRRVMTAAVLAGLALLVYLGSHISRAVSLPDQDLDKLATARLGDEQIVIERPEVAAGELALSYVGSRNEVAGLWLKNAVLDAQSRRLFGGSDQPSRINYTLGEDPANLKTNDTCHSTVEVRRGMGSAPIAALRLYQTDETAGAQRFRQVVVDPGAAGLDVFVSTDSPVEGEDDFPGCHKLLTIGGQQPVELPMLPVRMVVQGGTIDLHFNPANPAVPIWTGPESTFLGVSLGDSALQAGRVQVIATAQPKKPRLDVAPAGSTQTVTVRQLRLGDDHISVSIGRDGEKATAYANGKSLYNYDLIAAVEKNQILGGVLGVFLIPALWAWVRKNCLVRSGGE
jgi:hypothetical protein